MPDARLVTSRVGAHDNQESSERVVRYDVSRLLSPPGYYRWVQFGAGSRVFYDVQPDGIDPPEIWILVTHSVLLRIMPNTFA